MLNGIRYDRFRNSCDEKNHSCSWGGILRLLSVLLFVSGGVTARGDVTVFIEAPINFLGHVSSTGHAALLIDNLCSDDHIHIRWCSLGENGTVVSRYKGIGRYDWVAMPPGPYLFAVESPDQIPATADRAGVERLRTQYRAEHPGTFDFDPPDGVWIQLLGASYRRRIICIHVHTTLVQDERLMEWLDRQPNLTRFNFFFSNCADFARQMLDVLFPRAVHRDFLFDFGMTTPKQLVSSLHHYASKHRKLEFEVRELQQVPGDIPRSGHPYGVAESLVKSKPYLLPLAVLNPVGIGSLAAVGMSDHRYAVKNPAKIEGSRFFPAQSSIAAIR